MNVLGSYAELIMQLLYRMCNLEERYLHLLINHNETFVDDNNLKNYIINYLSHLKKFQFNIHSFISINNQINLPRLNDTVRIVSVYRENTVPYYCAQYYGVIRSIYGRKLGIFSSFTVRKRPVNDAVLIDMGTLK